MYPIRFEPIYQDYVWGADNIAKRYKRKAKGRVAESWELTDRHDAMSVALNGHFEGKTLRDIVKHSGEELLGHGQTGDRFPLILKIIDAKENLSIQVHPDELQAPDLKNAEAKTEMWVALDNSTVYAGLKEESNEEVFRKALASKDPAKLMEKFDLKKGELVYVPGGRVHSICGGSLLFEVQQNSNTTYRLHDWHRKDRELHLKDGLSCVHWHDKGHAKLAPHHQSSDFHHQLVLLGASPFFVIERIDIFDHHHIAAIPKTFQAFFCMHGEGQITVNGHKEPLVLGATYLVPAAAKSIEVDGRCELLRVRLP